MKLSLVIATYNRSASLVRTLQSVVTQTADPAEWECVVVNNNSTDSTAADFAAFAAVHPRLNLRMVDEPRQGLSNARNRGITEASGEYIAIVDDDETLVPEYIANYITFFDSTPQALAAGGSVVACYDSARPRWMSHYPERIIANPMHFGVRVREFPDNRVPAGGNMAFRSEVFERYGAFDTQLGRNGEKLTGGEETDLFARLRAAGNKLYYVPGTAIFHHIPDSKLSPDYFRRLCFDVGRSKRVRASLREGTASLLAGEIARWGVTLTLALFYTLTLRAAKAKYLLIMRRGISAGILAGEN